MSSALQYQIITKLLTNTCKVQRIQNTIILFSLFRRKEIGIIISFFIFTKSSQSQFSLDKDSIDYIVAHSPAFTIYKDNYFITGTSIGEKPTKYNSDIKFQVSFKCRILNEPIIWDSYAYVIYTQKSFWEIFHESSPFKENNYNPGILISKLLYNNNRPSGAIGISIEHESNGRDGNNSRSWNFASVSYGYIFSNKLSAYIKLWLPFGTSDNPDIIDYIGYSETRVVWTIKEKRLFLDVIGRKGKGLNLKGSILFDLSFRPTMKRNIYLELQWWHGYSESLIDYTKNSNMLRIGFVIRPMLLRFY